jgi:two-component system, NarL family, sensor histidine kinase DesK
MASLMPAETGAAGFGWRRLSGWRRYVFPGIWLVYLTETVAGVQTYSRGWAVGVGLAIVALFAVAYLLALPTAWRGHRSRFWAAYLTMLALCAAEAPFAHEHAAPMFVYLAVLTMSRQLRYALPIVAAFTVTASFGPSLVPAWHLGVQTIWLVTIPLVALAMWGFFGVIRSNIALAAARAEVARLAAENERTRIARDMHDLLGHSLTAITVKAGLARRLAEVGESDRAAAEIVEVERLSRRALADVRAAVAGHRDITLTGELATAREVLRAAGILAELPGSVDVVDPALSELFGWVVREGITNVVRHSRATHCTVALGPGWVEIVDDGRGGFESGGGTGLVGLRERVSAAGGTVDAGARTPGWRLRVEVPTPVEPARPDPASAPTIGT